MKNNILITVSIILLGGVIFSAAPLLNINAQELDERGDVIAEEDEEGRVRALDPDLIAIIKGLEYYDPLSDSSCSANFGSGDFSVISDTILERLEQHQDVYKEASRETGVPWELLATIHYRERSGRLDNPSNGQGIYQLYTLVERRGTHFFPPTTSDISREDFLDQTITAAKFVLEKDGARTTTAGQPLLQTGNDPRVIKELLFRYNGATGDYIEQARRIGKSDPWEGSPYVMNFASPLQHPDNFPDWRQVIVDEGATDQPANNEPGGWFVFAAIAGSTCDNPEGSKVLSVAQQEFAKKVVEDPVGSSSSPDIDNYTQNQPIPWSAAFVSWVYNEAGIPFEAGEANQEWLIPSGVAMRDSLQINDRFYTQNQRVPTPGDIIFLQDTSVDNIEPVLYPHIVDRIEGSVLVAIGGDIKDSVAERRIANYQTNPEVFGFGSQEAIGD